jgi:hypothetical protein
LLRASLAPGNAHAHGTRRRGEGPGEVPEKVEEKMKCKTCKWWKGDYLRLSFLDNPRIGKVLPVKECTCPDVRYQDPEDEYDIREAEKHQAFYWDEALKEAFFATGSSFGCIHHEENK